MRQTSFTFFGTHKNAFGGSDLKGKRKSARPLSTKNPIHLVLKSTGSSFFSPTQRAIEKLIRRKAQQYQIQIYDLALNWSHIHFLILIPSRHAYTAFIRTLTAEMVQLLSDITGKDLRGLFDLRPFTRIVSWGREFQNVLDYLLKNQLEARGLKAKAKINPKPKTRAKAKSPSPSPQSTPSASASGVRSSCGRFQSVSN